MRFNLGNRFAAIAVGTALAGVPAFGASDVAISQIYGGGGNSGATYTNDFIELHNRSANPVDLTGWSVQYASTSGTTWARTLLSGAIPAGGYYLIQQAAGTGGTQPLPAPDATGTLAMSANNGKVALSTGSAALSGSCPTGLADFVGYGTANCFEGTGAAPGLVNTTAGFRAVSGCADTDNNAADFATGAPAPRNSASAPFPCGGDAAPQVAAMTPASGSTGASAGTSITVTFNEPVDVTGAWFQISGSASGGHSAVVTGGPTVYTLNPDADFQVGETVTLTVFAAQVADADAIDPPDQPLADFTGSFSIAAPTYIHAIQGASHISPLVGQAVSGVPGVVTAVLGNGFFLQDPVPDADPATSEAIFVFTGAAPAVHVGDALIVGGVVTEFRPGGAGTDNLTTTEITAPIITVVSGGNPLPAPTVIGAAGRMPPGQVIDNDAATGNVETSGFFETDSDGIDFYESMEAMRVQVDDPVVVGPRNGFGEFLVLADSGAQASLRTARGGIKVRAGDFNPERIMVDDALAGTPAVNVGDRFAGPIVGVLDYQFANFKILSSALPAVVAGPLQREISPAACGNMLTMATFNVENLDPSDPQAKFDELAAVIVTNLRSPLLVGLEEVQDNTGAVNDGIVDASHTASRLIAAIQAAGGPVYQYRDIAPQNQQDGGEPGGNIRVGFLYQAAQGLEFVFRPGGTAVNSVAPVKAGAGVRLNFSPGRINPAHPSFDNSRKPLVGEFRYKHRTFFVIINHFNSKGGDDPLFGRFQPPTLSSETQRLQQAQQVQGFVQSLLGMDPHARIVVMGDFNDFEFSAPLAALKGATLVNMMETLPESERYSYVYEGNSQSLDHILVTPNLAGQAGTFYDVVHVNSEFAEQVSDHEPQRLCVDKGLTTDIGLYGEEQVQAGSLALFGVQAPIAASAPAVPEAYRTPSQAAADQAVLSPGLSTSFLTRGIADGAGHIELWPDAGSPTHAIFCVESERQVIGTFPTGMPKYNPSVQRIDRDGNVQTILRGLSRCGGLTRTPWGTILAAEAEEDGGAYEILHPLYTTEYTVLGRTSGDVADTLGNQDAGLVAKRSALPSIAWKGLVALPTGVVYAGDDARPGTSAPDADGGAILKFVPVLPARPGETISVLAQSPLVAGGVHALQVSCVPGAQQTGQGCETGIAAWIPVDAANARRDADSLGATGYHRPQDMEQDTAYADPEFPEAVRICWANAQDGSAAGHGEVLCAVDNVSSIAFPDRQSVEVSRFLAGDAEFDAFGDLEFQPGTGNLFVLENRGNADIFSCLVDGADRDRLSDGCIKVGSVKDSRAVPKGFAFTANGRSALLSIQHSHDGSMPPADGYPTDDVLLITGFQATATDIDAGLILQQQMLAYTGPVFGLRGALGASAPPDDNFYRHRQQAASDQALLAPGLIAGYLTRNVADGAGKSAFWPDASAPTHAIQCIEAGRRVIGTYPDGRAKYNPSVQRVALNGTVETILRGLDSCEGIRLTPWGSLLVAEGVSGGGAYEILDPLGTADFTVQDRAVGRIVDSSGTVDGSRIAKRTALPAIAWKGLTLLPSGTLYAVDGSRPGADGTDRDGGALFKFLPAVPAPDQTPIVDLSHSPLVAGSVHALQVSCADSLRMYGQGCETGEAVWITVAAVSAREDAADLGATGSHLPGDLDLDPVYADTAHPDAVRMCWTAARSGTLPAGGEVLCLVDRDPAAAADSLRTVTVNRFLEGGDDFTALENLAFQPGTGILYVTENQGNGDVFACLGDGADRDGRSDGCVKVLSLKGKRLNHATPGGFAFTADGRAAILSIRHSEDFHMTPPPPAYEAYSTDDILTITGFEIPLKF